MKSSSGFTLVEILVSLAVSATILMLAVPSLSEFLEKQRIIAQTQNIWRLLNKTRELAVTNVKQVSLCGLNEQHQCSRNNIQAFVIYTDSNKNGQLDGGETPLEYLEVKNSDIRVTNGKTFTYKSTGSVLQPSGIIVCSRKDHSRLIRKISVNRSGRVYPDPDRDGDGRIETAEGDIVEC